MNTSENTLDVEKELSGYNGYTIDRRSMIFDTSKIQLFQYVGNEGFLYVDIEKFEKLTGSKLRIAIKNKQDTTIIINTKVRVDKLMGKAFYPDYSDSSTEIVHKYGDNSDNKLSHLSFITNRINGKQCRSCKKWKPFESFGSRLIKGNVNMNFIVSFASLRKEKIKNVKIQINLH